MLTDTLKRVIRSGLGEGQEVDQLRLENANLRKQLERETMRSAEYFYLIERLEAQRNERWEMFLQQASEHANAQAMLEDQLMMTRQLLTNCATQLNAMRAKEGLEAVKKPAEFADPPIGTAADYRERMNILRDRAAALIDARKERSEISSRQDETVLQK
jgi:hypothetical protein